MDPLSVSGFQPVSAIALLSVLLYQIMGYTITIKRRK